MADQNIVSFQQGVTKTLEHLRSEFAKLQTGRANPAIVEHALVEAYGQKQELRTLAGISIQDARTIVIQPWDREILTQVEAAIRDLNIGTNPVNDGMVLRLVLPSMTEERRKQLSKLVDQLAEEARISLRQHRDEIRAKIKEEKDEDLRYSLMEELDKVTKEANDTIEASRKKKAEEVMTV